MHTTTKEAVFNATALNDLDFSDAAHAFFDAWKRGVELVGPELFGTGARECLEQAVCKWDLRPNMDAIIDAIGTMSSGEKVFLAAMVSFYNAQEGGALLRRVGVFGLADLGGLDLERRKVIAALILNYTGW